MSKLKIKRSVLKNKTRSNLKKQERVVEILWEFAHAQQTNPHNWESDRYGGTSANTLAVKHALRRVMDTFGYATIEVW